MTFDLRTRHSADLHHYSKASNGSSIPSNWRLAATGDSGVVWSPESSGGVSYGSNSNEVSYSNAPGASSLVSRADHVHKGVTSVSHSSNTYSGPITLETEGSLYIVRTSANTYRFGSGTAAGGGGGGGGVNRFFPLDRATLNGTYGDEFDGGSLNGRWTRHNQTSGEETYQVGGAASALRVAYSTAAAARYIYQTAPNGTNETWECCLAVAQTGSSTGQMYALLMVDSSGNGVAVLVYDNSPGVYLANVASHTYSSALASNTTGAGYIWQNTQRIYLRLRKASGVYYASFSFNGESYSVEISGTPSSFTPARVGVGRILGTASGDTVDWFWFDKTA